MGTGPASFAGGGAAYAGGPNSIFVNPAALSITDGLQAELGLMGLSGGFSPYALYGARASEQTSYAVGYFFDARMDPMQGGPARQGMIAGGSWEASPTASLGLSAHSQGTGDGVGLNGFGVDVDGGALFRPGNALWTGLSVRNLLESGVGQKPEGYRTRRSYQVAAGLRTPALKFLGLRLHDPDAFYELRAEGLPPSDAPLSLLHAFSAGSAFTPGGRLGLRGTFLLPQVGRPGFAMGIFLNLPVGKAGLVGGYTFDSGAGDDVIGESGPSHSISLNFRLGSRSDPFPPAVEVRADKLVLTPDSMNDVQVHFRLSASDKILGAEGSGAEVRNEDDHASVAAENGPGDYGRQLGEGRIKDWRLEIRAVRADGTSGNPIKAFQGMDLPPKLIRWDGRDETGHAVPSGIYAFRFSARDLAGNQSITAWQLLEIRAP